MTPWLENRESTHGVEVDIKCLSIKEPNNNTDVTLNMWDFGGQTIYRHTHQLFFTAPAVYLAVWNPRRGPEQCRVDEWIKMVKHRAFDEEKIEERPIVLVVATHGGPKERLDHIDEIALRNEFGILIDGFYHIDSKTKFGIEKLTKAIGESASNISHVGRRVPRTWMNVLESLRRHSEKVSHIPFKQYLKLCNRQGVNNELAKTYAVLFNEIGHLIYYNDDPILKEILILRPEWLTKAISFVLEDRVVKDQNGLVRYDHLNGIWNDPERQIKDRYSEPLHKIFLKLMDRFDLSYQVVLPQEDMHQTWLIAQLVPSGRPDDWQKHWPLNPGDKERTQVCRIIDAETGRTASAEGLIYRLIVRLHRYSLGRNNYYKSRHWKRGMILDDGFNGRALIEEISGDVRITVRAAYPERFLSHLCSEVEWLVEYFWKGLDARLYIPCHYPCKGLIEINEMMEYKTQGIAKIRCSVCQKFYDIDSLMVTEVDKPKIEEAISQLNDGQEQIFKAITDGFNTLSTDIRIIMSQADQQFEALLSILTDPAKDGPRLFSFEPIDYKSFNPKTWTKEKFRLTLWCEHSRLPLPLLNGDGDNSGVYEIELTRKWVKKAAPILKVISNTLKLFLPIAIPSSKLVTDDETFKAINEELDFGVKSADSLLTRGTSIETWLIEDSESGLGFGLEKKQKISIAHGVSLRELHTLIKKIDPSKKFGNLIRVRNKRHQFLWVHESFADRY